MVFTLPSSSDICMPDSVSNSAGNLRRHLRHVAGDLVHAGGIPVAGRDDGDLVDIRQRRGQRRTISGSPVISLSTTAAWFHS
jgi:hypothetical protein